MSNRNAFHRTLQLKPIVKGNSRTKRAGGVPEEPEGIEVLATPMKSESDDKIYKTIRLRNGLTALLISDPTEAGPERKAACALSVNVGSFSDPPGIQGLAHFVEHMVFMGSEKYPVENQFDQYVQGSGGDNNGFTEREMTTFHFEIQEPELVGAMEMLSQFFISPLMRKEAMQREREAVDSEFAEKVLLERRRAKHLLTCMFPTEHPYSKFPSGNLKSLRDELNNDTLLHCTAVGFRAEHYSANRMTVAVQSSMDILNLEASVARIFGAIPSSASQPDDLSRFAYSADTVPPKFRSLYYVKPVTDTSDVQLTWCMRSLLPKYKFKPLHYIAFFLRHEGKGSLLSYLKKKVWALNIELTDSDDEVGYSSINTFFSTRIQLTKDGLEHLDEVIEAVFSYLTMLRLVGEKKRIFNEMEILADDRFHLTRSPSPYDYVKDLALNMHIYPPEHYITGNQLYFKYDPTVIEEVLATLRPNNMNIMVVSNKHTKPIQYDVTEKWYGINYRREAIPQEWLRRWMNVAAYPEFKVPEKNAYITNVFTASPLPTHYLETARSLRLDLEHSTLHDIWIRTTNQKPQAKTFRKNFSSATVKNFRLYQPNLFFKSDHMEVWYKPELKWRTAITILYIYFVLPLSLQTPKELCLLDLWNDVVQEGLQDQIFRANLADFSHKMSIENGGVLLRIRGFSQHLPLLVDTTMNGMRTAMGALTLKMFEALRDVRARTYHNELIKAHKLSEDVLMEVLQKSYISPRHKAAWINKVTFQNLQDFGQRVLKRMYMQVLIQGNTPWYQAINIAKKAHRLLDWEALPENEQPEFKVHQLPLGERRVRVWSFNKLSTSSIVTNYYQGDVYTAQEMALLYHIGRIMKDRLYNELRTKEQLGYTISEEAHNTIGVDGYSITVHTHAYKHRVQHVENRIEAFLKNYLRALQTWALNATCSFDVRIFNSGNEDVSLHEEVEGNWAEIIHRQYNFERQFQFRAATNNLTWRYYINWMENHLASGNKSMFRKLSVQIVGHQQSNDSKTPTEEPGPSQMTDYKLNYLKSEPGEKASEHITNIENFTRNLPLMAVPKRQPA